MASQSILEAARASWAQLLQAEVLARASGRPDGATAFRDAAAALDASIAHEKSRRTLERQALEALVRELLNVANPGCTKAIRQAAAKAALAVAQSLLATYGEEG